MQIVIEIDEETYKNVLHQVDDIDSISVDALELEEAIYNGTPLPKGHGDLVDRNVLLEYTDINGSAYIPVINRYEIITAPTIIEAEFPLTDTERSYLATVQNDINRKRCLAKSKKAYGKHVGE